MDNYRNRDSGSYRSGAFLDNEQDSQREIDNETPTNSTDRQRISSSEVSGNHALPDNRSYAVRDIRREMFINEKLETTIDIDRNKEDQIDDNGSTGNNVNCGNNDSIGDDDRSNMRPLGSQIANTKDILGISDSVRVFSSRSYMGRKKTGKTISTKLEADWLKRIFPKVIKGEKGHFAIKNSGAGFDVYFRVDKRQTGAEPINLKFPYLTRETFLTWKGLSNEQARKAAEKYVRGYILDAIASGDNRARIVAGKLSNVA